MAPNTSVPKGSNGDQTQDDPSDQSNFPQDDDENQYRPQPPAKRQDLPFGTAPPPAAPDAPGSDHGQSPPPSPPGFPGDPPVAPPTPPQPGYQRPTRSTAGKLPIRYRQSESDGNKCPPFRYHDASAELIQLSRSRWNDQTSQDGVPSTIFTSYYDPLHSSGVDDAPAVANEMVEKLCREGGVELADFLLCKAISPESENLPGPSHNYREWTYKDIQRLPAAEQKGWSKACETELEALKQHRKVYDLVDRPTNTNVIKCRWVFNEKTDGRKKARLVAKGFTQVEGEDFSEVFSPVVRFETARCMMALAALNNWHISSLDVTSAFLYGELDEELYMEQPEGFKVKGQEQKVCRLKPAIYGLRQAAIVWWKALDKSMAELGFRRCKSDASVFVYKRNNDLVVCLVYVDDCLFFGSNKALVERLKSDFMKKWESRDLGPATEFLRMRIQRQGSKILLDQRQYLEKVLERCGMQNAKPAPTPLPAGCNPKINTSEASNVLRQRYQVIIGSLLYLMLGTRPDISFAVTMLSRYASNPTQQHLNLALYVCRYLKGTSKYALVYDGATGHGLEAFTDSDWRSSPDTRRSTSGYFLTLADGLFTWTTRTQKVSCVVVYRSRIYGSLGLLQTSYLDKTAP